MLQGNINDVVRVVLTPEAEKVWADYWTATRQLLEGKPGVPDSCRHTDSVGRTSFSLHELMLIFGQEMWMGNTRQMFKENKIWYEREG